MREVNDSITTTLDQQVKMLSGNQNLKAMLAFVLNNRRNAPNKAIEVAKRGIELAQEVEDYPIETKLHQIVGGINVQKGNLSLAKRHLFTALELYHQFCDDLELLATIQLSIGSYYFDEGDFENALLYFLKILQYNIEHLKPALYNNIASVYLKLKQYNRAFNYLFRGLKISKNLRDKDRKIFFLYNIGEAYKFQKDYDKAIDYYGRAAEAIEDINGYQYMKCLCLTQIGIVKCDLGEYKAAFMNYQKALKVSREYKLDREEVRILRRIGEMMLTQSNHIGFLDYQYQSIALAEEHQLFHEKLENLKNLKDYYQKQNNYIKAYEYAEAVISLQNKIFTKERDSKIAQIVKEKSYEIALLEKKNSQIEERNDLLIRTNKELEEFAYVVAHDLREPLRSIISFTNLLERRYKANIDQSGREFMNYIVNSAKHMSSLLADLLEYTTVDKSEIYRENIPVREVVNQILSLLNASITESNTRFEIGELPEVACNRTHLKQMFQQLIHNAIKFRRRDRQCVIEIEYEEREEHYLFIVRDNGIGIKQEYLDKIFKIFNRLDKKKYKGTGIGLAICKKIVQLYGGEIWVTSKPNEGSTFYFTLRNDKI